MNSDENLLQLLEHIDDTGVAIVTGVPVENLAVVGLAERVACLEESHFGRYFDVESKPNPENLAYTPQALYPHNDLPAAAIRREYSFCIVCITMPGGEKVSWLIPSRRPESCNRWIVMHITC